MDKKKAVLSVGHESWARSCLTSIKPWNRVRAEGGVLCVWLCARNMSFCFVVLFFCVFEGLPCIVWLLFMTLLSCSFCGQRGK